MSGDARLILVAGALLAAGVLASMAASRLRLPALLLFLGVGMAVGSDGLGWSYLDDYALARLVGTVALLVILFEGGLQTGFLAHELVVGLAAGLVVGGVAAAALRRMTDAPTGLPLVASFATAAVAFGAAGTVADRAFSPSTWPGSCWPASSCPSAPP
jgi:NhaP-type Na+/H+ or K+/H+ antiporter